MTETELHHSNYVRLRLSPDEQLEAAWPYLMEELSRQSASCVAPSSATSQSCSVTTSPYPLREELEGGQGAPDFRGRLRVYVRELLFPGDASVAVATPIPSAGGARRSSVEAWIYVVHLPSRTFVSETRATTAAWTCRENPRAAPGQVPTTPCLRDFVTFDGLGGGPCDYAVMLSSLPLTRAGMDVLLAAPPPGCGTDALRAATAFVRWGARCGFVAVPDVFRWACDAHGTFHQPLKDDLDAFNGDERRVARRYVARTLKALRQNGDPAGITNELVDFGQPIDRYLAEQRRQEVPHQRALEHAACYVGGIVNGPAFRAAEVSAMTGTTDTLSFAYQVWALVTTDLAASHCGRTFLVAWSRADDPHLPAQLLWTNAEPNVRRVTAPHLLTATAAVTVLVNLAPALARDDRLVAVARRLFSNVEEHSYERVFHRSPEAGAAPSLARGGIPQVVLAAPGNLLGHTMPQGQMSGLLHLNGMFVLTAPQLGDGDTRQVLRSAYDNLLWNLQNSYIQKAYKPIKRAVKIINFCVALDRWMRVDAGTSPSRRDSALRGMGQQSASLTKLIASALDDAPSSPRVGPWEAPILPELPRHRAFRGVDGVLSALDAALEIYAFTGDAVNAWSADDRGQAVGHAIGALGNAMVLTSECVKVISVLPRVASVGRFGVVMSTRFGLLAGAVISVGYFVANAAPLNMHKQFAGWSSFGTRHARPPREARSHVTWTSEGLPALDVRNEARALADLLSQFKLVYREEDGVVDIVLGHAPDDLRIDVVVECEEMLPGERERPAGVGCMDAAVVSDAEAAALRAGCGSQATRFRRSTRELHLRACDAPPEGVRFQRDHELLRSVTVRVPHGERRDVDGVWHTVGFVIRVRTRVGAGREEICVPRDQGLYLQLGSGQVRSPQASAVEVLSADDTKWVMHDGAPRLRVTAA